MRYFIIENTNLDSLISKVNSYLKTDWNLHGEFRVLEKEIGFVKRTVFYQAMIKEGDYE